MRLLLRDLQPAQTYSLQLRSRSDEGVSDWSRKLEFETLADLSLPQTPGNVVLVSSGDSFHAEWDSVFQNTNGIDIPITRYELEIVASGVTAIQSVPQITGTIVMYDLSFEANRALFGTPQPNIAIRVRAVDNKELKSAWSNQASASNPVPDPPTTATVKEVVDGVDISWLASPSTDLIGYRVYVGTVSNFTPASNNMVFFGDATHFSYASTTYTIRYFKIRAVDKFNQESTDLAASGTPGSPFGGDSTPPAIPTGLSATITTENTASLHTFATVSWNANTEPDLAGYVLKYRKEGSSTWSSVFVDAGITSIIIDNLAPHTDYDFIISSYDAAFNYSGNSSIFNVSGAANTAPSTPSAPSVSGNTLQVQVSIPGTKASGGGMEADVAHYEVYASTTSGFTTYNATTMLGIIVAGPTMIETFSIPASGGGSTQTWYVKVIAVDGGGLKSAASAQATSTPGLIAGTNITDATITNAKIGSLDANKITAGTGFVNDITVKSTFTLGDASNNGIIRSNDYVTSGGAAGFYLDKDEFIIKSGAIEAGALKIQYGENLVRPEYAGFEAHESFYLVGGISINQGTPTLAMGAGVRGVQGLAVSWTAQASNPIIYLGSSSTDYNIDVIGSTDYIASLYAWNPGGASTTVALKAKWSTGAVTTIASSTLAAGGTTASATRIQGAVTAPSGATGMILFLEASTIPAGSFNIDAVQVEQRWGALTTASAWTAPGVTRIDGGIIRTGEIRSTAVARVWQMEPIYDTDGITIIGYQNGIEVDDPTGRPAWIIDTEGDAVFSRLSVRGNVVVGSVITPDAYTALSTVASANYVEGTAGWMMRSDGVVEFRQVEADSIDGAAIRANTLRAESLAAGTVTADITLSGSFETALQLLSIEINTVSGSPAVTADTDVFLPGDVGAVINAAGIPLNSTIIGYTSATSITISANATATASIVPATMGRGRKVRISGIDGIFLYETNGEPIIQIPTDLEQPTYFKGSFTATDMVVYDELHLLGTNNSIEQNAQLALATAVVPTKAPVVGFSWTQIPNTYSAALGVGTTIDTLDGREFIYDHFRNKYIVLREGRYLDVITGPGTGHGNFEETFSLVYNSSLDSGQSIALNASNGNYYIFTVTARSLEYRAQAFDSSKLFSGDPAQISTARMAVGAVWAHRDTESGLMQSPKLTIRDGKYYIVKTNLNSKIVLYRYPGMALNVAPEIAQVTSITATGVHSIKLGNFDFGVLSLAVTLHDDNAKVWNVNSTNFSNISDKTFPSPYSYEVVGTCWVGSGHDDATGYFVSLTSVGEMYSHTNFGKQSISTVAVNQKWRKQDVVAANQLLSAAGPSATISYKRRSIVTLTSSTPIPYEPGDPNSPDSVTFYMGEGTGTKYRVAEPGLGVDRISITTIPTVDAITGGGVLPAGVPAKIWSGPGLLEITADGHVHAGKTTAAATSAGNTPGLIVGSKTGSHLRVGSTSIQAMTSDTAQGNLTLNPSGTVVVGNLITNSVPYTFRKKTGSQSIPTSTFTILEYNGGSGSGITYDGAGTFTVSKTGKYSINAQVSFVASATGRRIIRLLVNGTAVRQVTVAAGAVDTTDGVFGLSHAADMTANDTFRIEVWQSSGDALGTNTSDVLNVITAVYVGS